MVIVGVPALELGVLSTLQDVLLALKVRVVVTGPSTALHTDGVHPVHEATVLEVIAVSVHFQLPASEASSLPKDYLGKGTAGRVGLKIRFCLFMLFGRWQTNKVKRSEVDRNI